MRMVAAGILVSTALAAPAAAYAQAQAQGDRQQGGGYITRVQPREHERIVLTGNVGYVAPFGLGYRDEGRARLASTGQSTRVTVDYDPGHSINSDGGVIVMLNRSWGLGGTFTVARFENVETVTNLAVRGREGHHESGIRKEKTARLEVTRVLVRREDPSGVIVRVFGGPAYQRLEQNVVTFRPDEPEMREGSGWGYHAGLDLSAYASMPGLGGGGFGFGGTVRYSGGSVRLPGLLDSESGGRPAGGWSFGGGIRFRL